MLRLLKKLMPNWQIDISSFLGNNYYYQKFFSILKNKDK
jgi:hypothetical protein